MICVSELMNSGRRKELRIYPPSSPLYQIHFHGSLSDRQIGMQANSLQCNNINSTTDIQGSVERSSSKLCGRGAIWLDFKWLCFTTMVLFKTIRIPWDRDSSLPIIGEQRKGDWQTAWVTCWRSRTACSLIQGCPPSSSPSYLHRPFSEAFVKATCHWLSPQCCPPSCLWAAVPQTNGSTCS